MENCLPNNCAGRQNPASRCAIGTQVPIAIFCALTVCLGFAFFTAWRELLGLVRHDPELNYVIALPVVMAMLIWVRRDRLHGPVRRGSWLGLGVIGLALMLSRLPLPSSLLDWQWFGSAGLAVFGVFVLVWGPGIVRAWAPALVLLALLVPLPEEIRRGISVPLERLTAMITALALRGVGMEVERFGNLLTVAGHPVNVAEACSGTRMVMSVGLAVYAYVFLHPLRSWVRLVLLGLAPVIALSCNVLRVAMSVAMYGLVDESSAAFFHDWTAWGMMVLAYFCCLGILSLTGWLGYPTHRGETLPSTLVRGGGESGPDAVQYPWRRGLPATLAALLLLATAWTQFAPEVTGQVGAYRGEVRSLTDQLQGPGPDWVGAEEPAAAAVVNLLRSNAMVQTRFTHTQSGETFWVAVVHCGQVRDLREHHPPQCYGNTGWQVSGPQWVSWSAGDREIPGNEYTMRRMIGGYAEQIMVNNTFLLPGIGATREHDAMLPRERDRVQNARGAAELQWVFHAGTPQARRRELVQGFINTNRSLIELLCEGPQP